MGSFAYSLHVKCDDPVRAAAVIRELLARDQWRPSDKPPDEKVRPYGLSPDSRALWISTAVYGWVSVLDSDLAGAMSLATPLAETLNATTLLCMVNDSDSWGYVLSRSDGVLDEFDSAGEGGVPDELSDAELAQMGKGVQQVQAKLADGSLVRSIQDINEEMVAQAPAEMKQIHQRMQKGQATPEEIAAYSSWVAAESPKYLGRIKQLVGELFQVPSLSPPSKNAGKTKKRKRKKTKSARAAADQRLDHLRPLLVAGVNDEQLQEVLDEHAVFAEETLARFLPLFGIPGFYAYLDYGHKDEASPAELAAHGIQFAHHLMFETGS